MYAWCQLVVFFFGLAQAVVNYYVTFMNMIGITTPTMTLPAGSFFGCDV